MIQNDTIRTGTYRHYKGNIYVVLGVANHTEDKSEFVVYQALYGDRKLWIRPKTMFLEPVIYDGELRPRFEYVG